MLGQKKSLVREFYSLTKYLFINIFFFYLKVFKLKIKEKIVVLLFRSFEDLGQK